MKEWLTFASEHAIVIIEALALIIIFVGTVECFLRGFALMFSSQSSHERRDVWLHYARWLVAGLTFQLAADIIETSITASWDAVGRLAADCALAAVTSTKQQIGGIGADHRPARHHGEAGCR